MEFLTEAEFTVPSGTDPRRIDELKSAESVRASELAAERHLIRLWRPQADGREWRNIGIWRAADEAELRQILSTLPLFEWMTVLVRPLLPHPSDPGSST